MAIESRATWPLVRASSDAMPLDLTAQRMRRCLVLGLIAALWLAASIGAAGIDLSLPWQWLLSVSGLSDGTNPGLLNIVHHIRMPRVVLAALIGAALAVSGASLQGLCRNPLADPGLLGITTGAAAGAVCVIACARWISLPAALMPYLIATGAFLSAALCTFLVYRMARIHGSIEVAILLLSGVAITALAAALINVMSYTADDQSLRLITYWLMGSLSGAGWPVVLALAPVLLWVIYAIHQQRHALNLLLLGDDNALHMGVHVAQVKNRLLWLNALMVGLAVSVSGSIGFIGLVVPHLLRLMNGSNHHHLILNAALLGALLLCAADVLSRIAIAPAELPIGVITALLGAPFFMLLLWQQRHSTRYMK